MSKTTHQQAKSVGDPTGPKGTRRPDEPPAGNHVQPAYTRLDVQPTSGGPNLPMGIDPHDAGALVDLYLTENLLRTFVDHTNAYMSISSRKTARKWPELHRHLNSYTMHRAFMLRAGIPTAPREREPCKQRQHLPSN